MAVTNLITLPERTISVADIVLVSPNGTGCAISYNNGGGPTSFNTVQTVTDVISLANVNGVRLIPITTTDTQARAVNATRIAFVGPGSPGVTDMVLNYSSTSSVIHVVETVANIVAAANA